MKKLIRRILKEDLDYWGVSDASPDNDVYNMSSINEDMDEIDIKRKKYLDKISIFMEGDYPLFKNLKNFDVGNTLSEEDLKYVFSKILGADVERVLIDGGGTFYNDKNDILYRENYNGKFWEKYEYDEDGNLTYFDNNRGSWEKYEYDENGNEIYSENWDGQWEKNKYNENGKVIYREYENGLWKKWEYDENGNMIYFHNSKGYWGRREYDENGNEIYSVDSNGYWENKEYAPNGNLIYYEDSNGNIEDNR